MYLQSCRLAVCKQCQYAVVAGGLSSSYQGRSLSKSIGKGWNTGSAFGFGCASTAAGGSNSHHGTVFAQNATVVFHLGRGRRGVRPAEAVPQLMTQVTRATVRLTHFVRFRPSMPYVIRAISAINRCHLPSPQQIRRCLGYPNQVPLEEQNFRAHATATKPGHGTW